MPKFIEWDGTYTPQQQAVIDMLKDEADHTSFHSAVVDYLGRADAEDGLVDLDAEPSRRFGIRSLSHVGIYKLRVIHYGKRAREAGFSLTEGE